MKTLALILTFGIISTAEAGKFTPNYEAKIGADLKEFTFDYVAGQVQIKYDAKSNRNDVKCELSPNTKPKSPFNFETRYKKFNCEITLSRPLKLRVNGRAGQIQASNLISDTKITLDDGQIQFTSNPSINYDFDVKLEHGMTPMMPMSKAPKTGNPVPMKLYLTNGMISVL